MKFFLDTEFAEAPGSIDLISVGIVADDGREFYAINTQFNERRCNEWVRANVLSRLPPRSVNPTDPSNSPRLHAESLAWMKPETIRDRVRAFIGTDKPEFWGYYADYDWVAFCWLFGAMSDLPQGWPMYCRDLKQWSDQIGAPKFDDPKGEHHALADARWNREMHAFLTRQEEAARAEALERLLTT